MPESAFEIWGTQCYGNVLRLHIESHVAVAGLIGQNILSEEKVDLLLISSTTSTMGVQISIVNWAGKDEETSRRNDWNSCEGAPIRLAEEIALLQLSEVVLIGEVISELARGQLGVAERNVIEVPGIAGAYWLVRATDTGKVPMRVVKITNRRLSYPATNSSVPS